MIHDQFDLKENDSLTQTDAISSDKASPVNDKSSFNEAYSKAIKTELENLKKTNFTGISQDTNIAEIGNEPACSVTMNSQYESLEVNMNPIFVKNVLEEAGIDNSKTGLEQIIQVAVTLTESYKSAANDARKKAHLGSEKVFNQLMETMQTDLFKSKE